VILGITNTQQLQAAWNELQAKLPGAVLLQRQLQGTELILGMQKDPSFGPIFTVGLGGIFVEIMKDVALLLPVIPNKPFATRSWVCEAPLCCKVHVGGRWLTSML